MITTDELNLSGASYPKRLSIDYQTLFTYFPIALLVCDRDLRILAANDNFLALFRRVEPEVFGVDLPDVFGLDTEETEKVRYRVEALLRSKAPFTEVEMRYVFPKVGYKIVRMRLIKILDEDGLFHVLMTMDDLTFSIALDRKIREVKGELQVLFDGITDGIAIIDRDYRIQRINQGLLDKFQGRSYTDFLGEKCYVKLQSRGEVCNACPVQKTFETGEEVRQVQSLEDGKQKLLFEVRTFPLSDADGVVQRVILYFQDITSKTVLDRQVIEHECNKAVEVLCAGLTHELRNPLAVIRSTAQLSMEMDDDPEELGSSLDQIIASVDNIDMVLKRLISYARPLTMRWERFRIDEIIDDAVSLMEEEGHALGVEIAHQPDGETTECYADRDYLLKALSHVIQNGIEACSRKNGAVRIRNLPSGKNGMVKVMITDNGRGLNSNQQQRAFDLFFSTKKKGGAGFGLAEARKIINSMGGSMSLESKEGEGTSVIIEIPLSPDTDTASQEAPPSVANGEDKS